MGSVQATAQPLSRGYLTKMLLPLLSKVVGYGIIIPAFILQVPQILAVWRSWSVEGLSLPTLMFELTLLMVAITFSTKMGFPLNAWGEAIPVAFQMLVLLTLSFWISRGRSAAFSFFFLTVTVFTLLTTSSVESLWYIQLLFTFLALGGKTKQVIDNYLINSTGQLSLITSLLATGGVVIRVFTTFVETPGSGVQPGETQVMTLQYPDQGRGFNHS